jgi:hypothetical protein
LAREFLYVARNYGLCFLHGKLFEVVYQVWSSFALGVARFDLFERHILVDVSEGLGLYWCEDGDTQARPSMEVMMISNMTKDEISNQLPLLVAKEASVFPSRPINPGQRAIRR